MEMMKSKDEKEKERKERKKRKNWKEGNGNESEQGNGWVVSTLDLTFRIPLKKIVDVTFFFLLSFPYLLATKHFASLHPLHLHYQQLTTSSPTWM